MSDVAINNHFYDELDERWYNDDGHIIALLRAETKVKAVYVREVFAREGVPKHGRILDVGCGAGFISNLLAGDGYDMHGLDQSKRSIAVAERHIPAGRKVHYTSGDAYALPYPDGSFDAVLLLDFLEHVEEPKRAIAEAARVVKPGGIVMFYTFNRTFIAGLLAVKAVEFIARDCPKNFHLLRMFIKPAELETMARSAQLRVQEYRGLRPMIWHWPFFSSILSRTVHRGFDFTFTSNLQLGYMGFASKSLGSKA